MKIKFYKPPTEHETQTAIIEYLKYKGYYCQRVNAGAFPISSEGRMRYVRMADPGTPDIIFGLPYKNLTLLSFIEVKTPKGVLNPNQREFQFKAEKKKMLYIVARSLEDVEIGIDNYLNTLQTP